MMLVYNRQGSCFVRSLSRLLAYLFVVHTIYWFARIFICGGKVDKICHSCRSIQKHFSQLFNFFNQIVYVFVWQRNAHIHSLSLSVCGMDFMDKNTLHEFTYTFNIHLYLYVYTLCVCDIIFHFILVREAIICKHFKILNKKMIFFSSNLLLTFNTQFQLIWWTLEYILFSSGFDLCQRGKNIPPRSSGQVGASEGAKLPKRKVKCNY